MGLGWVGWGDGCVFCVLRGVGGGPNFRVSSPLPKDGVHPYTEVYNVAIMQLEFIHSPTGIWVIVMVRKRRRKY